VLRQLELMDALSQTLHSGATALAELPLEAALVDLKLALDQVGAILGVDGQRRGPGPQSSRLLSRQVTALEALSRAAQAPLERRLTEKEQENFGKYLILLLKWQKAHRLVGSDDPMWIVEHLFLDSLLFLKLPPRLMQKLADVGSRCGLPGLPI
jgi:hypothetical protein